MLPQAMRVSACFPRPLPIQFVNTNILKALYMYCQIAFQKGCTSLHSHQLCATVLVYESLQAWNLPVRNSVCL